MSTRVHEPYGPIELRVDGMPIDVFAVWEHYQDDPYPGGHRYELIVRGEAVRELSACVPQNAQALLDRHAIETFFTFYNYSKRLLQPAERRVPRVCQFVLNTVDSIESSGSELRVGGVCSPFVD